LHGGFGEGISVGVVGVIMSGSERPKGLASTAAAMSVTNAMGWAIIDWSLPTAWRTFIVSTILIAIGYGVIWFYWKGKNWARVLVLLTCLLSLFNLSFWNRNRLPERAMIGIEAALSLFLLYWLNTRKVSAFFAAEKPNK
jgi:hypothetical protein